MPTMKDEMLSTLRVFSGQQNTITVPRAFVRFTGSLESGIMLSQIIYWYDKTGKARMYKSDAEFADEICLTKYAIRKARATLESMGIIKTEVHRANGTPTLHYYLQTDTLVEKWTLWIQKMDFAKSKNQTLRNRKITNRDYTEITTDISPNGEMKKPFSIGDEKQICGHSVDKISKNDDGTQYCTECASNAEFDALPSASADIPLPTMTDPAVASPVIERERDVEKYAELFARILRQEPIKEHRTAASKMLQQKWFRENRRAVDKRLKQYLNSNGTQFQKPGASAWFILAQLQRDLASGLKSEPLTVMI